MEYLLDLVFSVNHKYGNAHGLLWKMREKWCSSHSALCHWKTPDIKFFLDNQQNFLACHSLSICFVLHWCSTGFFSNGYLSPKISSSSWLWEGHWEVLVMEHPHCSTEDKQQCQPWDGKCRKMRHLTESLNWERFHFADCLRMKKKKKKFLFSDIFALSP